MHLFVPCIFSTYGMKTNWCHYFIRILLDLYMFRAHRPIFRRVRTAVHTTIGSVSVPLCYIEWKPTDVTILFVYCWISTCFGPTGPSSGEFVQLFTQPLVQYLCRSVRTRTEQHRNWTNGCVNSCTNSPEDGPVGPKHIETQQFTNKIVTSVGFHSI